ncbi:hypothetical protein [Priestia megaterium]|uniref:hypothetical protein n=1 Tax=Priestia megaterium TaxID=1404 RepID=UPI000BFE0113|nr:hypothetical protein [Priestia megaterium]PGO60747.1 hypothetical protein CN981_09420 [Priestia megaterium]
MPKDLRTRHLNVGTMNATKSAQLIMKGFQLDQQGKKVLTFKPEGDSRDGAFVVSRATPIKRPAIVVPKKDNGVMMSSLVWSKNPDVILIDEIQFFTVEQIEKIAEISITYDVDIYAYGLLLSYTGMMFESTKRMIESGFKFVNIEMTCDLCHNDATHHLLYVDGELETRGDAIVVEDKEFQKKDKKYQSVCFSCYHMALDVAEMKEKEKQQQR